MLFLIFCMQTFIVPVVSVRAKASDLFVFFRNLIMRSFTHVNHPHLKLLVVLRIIMFQTIILFNSRYFLFSISSSLVMYVVNM